MPAEAQNPAVMECRTPQGLVLARVFVWPPRGSENLGGEAHPLIRWTDAEAQTRGEEAVQLRERCRYVYRLKPADGVTLPLALVEGRGITHSPAAEEGEDEGFIEPGDHCGLLPLVVTRKGDDTLTPLARGAAEVRSVKLGYRDHYRGMLSLIAERAAGLLLDSRAPARLRLATDWKRHRALLEQQLEFLRHTLESSAFRAAVDEVLRNPHRRLEEEPEQRDISRPFKVGRDFARQVAMATERRRLPSGHPLRALQPQLESLPVKVTFWRKADFLDTAENRFAKMVLTEFRDFLAEVRTFLSRESMEAERSANERLLRETGRLRGLLESLLGRGFFPDVSTPTMVPLGSSALQRKSGYRELLRFWLQFHAGAQLAWDGGREVYEGGARNVATLYEYWLFFQLEALFRAKFACAEPLHALLVECEAGLPRLKLRRGVALRTPVGGVWSKTAGRKLRAEFQFNRKFTRRDDRTQPGSWTRGVQPDFTISIWPAEFSAAEAEAKELMVHVHFDAKYRVEQAHELLGDEADDAAFVGGTGAKDEQRTAAKYADLLKMHAYRDAIRRTAGAYVLYPGNAAKSESNRAFHAFHEILPGLGAFAIRPRRDGSAEGMEALAKFLDDVVEHLANRTTARERVSYHVAEAYELMEAPVLYGSLQLPEADIYGTPFRALPPAEQFVVVAWFDSPAQLEWTRQKKIANVRLGRRTGTWHVPPEISSARHLLLRTHGGVVAPGLWRLRQPGYKVYTVTDLRKTDYPGAAGGEIYAVFDVEEDPAWQAQDWKGEKVMEVIEAYESSVRHRVVLNLGRTSPYPRVLPLRDLLKARV
jgi:predicted component of viral defense system (DUF524 family)